MWGHHHHFPSPGRQRPTRALIVGTCFPHAHVTWQSHYRRTPSSLEAGLCPRRPPLPQAAAAAVSLPCGGCQACGCRGPCTHFVPGSPSCGPPPTRPWRSPGAVLQLVPSGRGPGAKVCGSESDPSPPVYRLRKGVPSCWCGDRKALKPRPASRPSRVSWSPARQPRSRCTQRLAHRRPARSPCTRVSPGQQHTLDGNRVASGTGPAPAQGDQQQPELQPEFQPRSVAEA